MVRHIPRGVLCESIILFAGYVANDMYSYGAKFYIIAPHDGVFFNECYTLLYGYCHGVYFGHKNNTQLATIINLLSLPPIFEGGVKHCGDHGNINKFGITCSPSKIHFHNNYRFAQRVSF